MRQSRPRAAWIAASVVGVLVAAGPSAAAARPNAPPAGDARATERVALALRQGDRVVLLGNTLAERQQHFNHFETLLMTRFPDLRLVVRNLGWSGDTLTLQPRPLNFGDAAYHLSQQRADVVIAFFGLNESFEGEDGLSRFESDLDAYLRTHLAATYNGRTPPRMALVSPIAHEHLPRLAQVDAEGRNRELTRYTAAMQRAADRHGVAFVDLFTPTQDLMAQGARLTINGIHVNEAGDRVIADLLMDGLGFGGPALRVATAAQAQRLDALREQIRLKNEEFFRRWRPLNAEYIVGRRVEPFGSVNFPPEMRTLEARIEELDRQVWRRARGLKGIRYPEAPAASAQASGRED
jgi:lysophospholipase L1-like esterase